MDQTHSSSSFLSYIDSCGPTFFMVKPWGNPRHLMQLLNWKHFLEQSFLNTENCEVTILSTPPSVLLIFTLIRRKMHYLDFKKYLFRSELLK